MWNTCCARLAERGFETPRSPGALEMAPVEALHDAGYLAFLRDAWAEWTAAGFTGEIIAANWPARRMQTARPPRNIDGKVGYYALAAETAITAGTWAAAQSSAASAQAAQRAVAAGERAAFALCRPPGHHAARDMFGGYCFLNNAAIAAQMFADGGAARVAVLDIDFHHGNGTQDIFCERGDVFFASIHGAPEDAFPYFLGHADETGAGEGEGTTANYPMPPGTAWSTWSEALVRALAQIEAHGTEALVCLARDGRIRARPDQLLQAHLRRLPARGRTCRPQWPAHRLLHGGRLRHRAGRPERGKRSRGLPEHLDGRRASPRPVGRAVPGLRQLEHRPVGAARAEQLQPHRQAARAEARRQRERRAGPSGRPAPPPASSGDRCPFRPRRSAAASASPPGTARPAPTAATSASTARTAPASRRNQGRADLGRWPEACRAPTGRGPRSISQTCLGLQQRAALRGRRSSAPGFAAHRPGAQACVQASQSVSARHRRRRPPRHGRPGSSKTLQRRLGRRARMPSSNGKAPPQSPSQPMRRLATSAIQRPARPRRCGRAGQPGSRPAITSSSGATSAGLRAIGPSVESAAEELSPSGSAGTSPTWGASRRRCTSRPDCAASPSCRSRRPPAASAPPAPPRPRPTSRPRCALVS